MMRFSSEVAVTDAPVCGFRRDQHALNSAESQPKMTLYLPHHT